MKLTGENRSTRGKTCPSATLSTTNPIWTDPGSNPATNCLIHGTATFTLYLGLLCHVWSTIIKIETGKFWLYKAAFLYLQHLTDSKQRTCVTICSSKFCLIIFDIHVLHVRIYFWKYYCMLCQRCFRNWTRELSGTPSLSCIHCKHSEKFYYPVHFNLCISSSTNIINSRDTTIHRAAMVKWKFFYFNKGFFKFLCSFLWWAIFKRNLLKFDHVYE
jgi:hypothetical protein